MKKVLLLNGPPLSGKDTVADILQKHGYKFHREKFAMPLVLAAMAFFGLETFEELEGLKRADPRLRKFMIGLSFLIKRLYGKDFFGKTCAYRLEDVPEEFVVITDCGFIDEADAFIAEMLQSKQATEQEIVVCQVNRGGTSFDNDSREWVTLKEHPRVRTYVVDNPGELGASKGSTEDFERLVMHLVSHAFGI